MKSDDGRKGNGAADRGLQEGTVLVSGPKALIDAMRAEAESEGVSVREIWRRAALAYLAPRRYGHVTTKRVEEQWDLPVPKGK